MHDTTSSTTPTTTKTAARRTVLSLTVGPALVLAGLAATPWETEKTTAAYHESLLASPTQAQVAAVLLAFGYGLLGLAAFAVLRRTHGQQRRLWWTAAVLAYLGSALMPGLLVTDFYDLAMAQTLPAADAVRASEAAQDQGLGALMFVPGIAGLLLGPVAATTVAVRARLVGVWAPLVIVAGFVAGGVWFHPVTQVLWGLGLLAAYAAMAAGLLRGAAAVCDEPASSVRASRTSQAPVPVA